MIITRAKAHQQLHVALTLLVVATIPFSIKLNGFLIILLSVNFLLEGGFRTKFRRLKHNTPGLMLLGFYLLHVIGVLYSANTATAFAKLETFASFFILALLFASLPPANKAVYDYVLKAFVASCTLASFVCMAYALYNYFAGTTGEFLFYHHYSTVLGLHAIYLSMYLLLCLCILVYFMRRSKGSIQYVYGLLFIFLLLNMALLSSKMIIAMLIIIVNIYLLYFLFRRMPLYKIAGLVVGANILVVAVLFLFPPVKERFSDIAQSNFEVVRQEKYRYDTPFSGLTIRLVFWKSTLRVLNEENAWAIGVGTGDAQDLLDQTYKNINLYTGNPELGDKGYLGYSPHNQYMETLLKVGLFGLGYLLLILIFPLFHTEAFRNPLPLFFLLIVSLACLSESILELQKGVVFFSFFYSFLIINQRPIKGQDLSALTSSKAR